MSKLYPVDESKMGSIDWLNEVTQAYLAGDYARANVAAIMATGDSVEALRLLLLEGTDGFGEVGPIPSPSDR